ncbi:MAG: AAA domain-containing protein [Thermofilum sp.]
MVDGEPLRFCPECGSLPWRVRRGNETLWICRACSSRGSVKQEVGAAGSDDTFQRLRDILKRERELAVKDALRTTVSARVLDASSGVVTLEVKYEVFEAGDPVGVKMGEEAELLGTVIDAGGGFLTVILSNPDLRLEEGSTIRIFDYELLISYDLQLELLDSIEGKGKIPIRNWSAVRVMTEGERAASLLRSPVSDRLDVKERFELNDSQIEAVEAALGLRDSELLLVVGPPGTGKTRVIAKIAYELARKGRKVLISCHTNRAVDNAIELLPIEIALRVGRPEKVTDSVRGYLLSYKIRERYGEELRKIEEELRRHLDAIRRVTGYLEKGSSYERGILKETLRKLKDRVRQLYLRRSDLVKRAAEELVEEALIVGATLVKSQLPPLTRVYFDTVIIDEASQASITLALLAMVKARRWVLVGDHKQLQPIFRGLEVEECEEFSAFTRLYKKCSERSLWLRTHYRSNFEIAEFIAKHIYEGRIHPAEICRKKKLKLSGKPSLPLLDPEKPIVFVDVRGYEIQEGRSKLNPEEAQAVSKIVKELCRLGVEDIGVITPYRAQRNILAGLKELGAKVEVDTVDAFQGREKDVVIYSVTATSGLRFAAEPHRLAVALSRARLKLIVVGNAEAVQSPLYHDTLLFKYYQHCSEKGAVYTWPPESPAHQNLKQFGSGAGKEPSDRP